MAITSATRDNPMSGLIRPGLPVIFSNGFEEGAGGDFADWDTQVQSGPNVCTTSVANPRTGGRSLVSGFANLAAYVLKGLSITAREIEADFWLAHIANDSFGENDWVAVMTFEVAPAGFAAVCGYGYSDGNVVPMVRLANMVFSTNFVMTEADIYRNWVARAGFTKSGSYVKLFIDGLLVAQNSRTGDRSGDVIDQFGMGYPTNGGGDFTCSDYIDDLVLRGRV